jgi:hypothetical protein
VTPSWPEAEVPPTPAVSSHNTALSLTSFIFHTTSRIFSFVTGPEGVTCKGKGKGKVKFYLEQATKAQRGSRGIALLFL